MRADYEGIRQLSPVSALMEERFLFVPGFTAPAVMALLEIRPILAWSARTIIPVMFLGSAKTPVFLCAVLPKMALISLVMERTSMRRPVKRAKRLFLRLADQGINFLLQESQLMLQFFEQNNNFCLCRLRHRWILFVRIFVHSSPFLGSFYPSLKTECTRSLSLTKSAG